MAELVTHAEKHPDAAIEAAREFQTRHLSYLAAGDIDGLVANCYTEDARLHSFQGCANGSRQLTDFIKQYVARLQRYDVRNVSFFSAGDDFIWQEMSLNGADGPVEMYEFKFLRRGKVYLQLLGEKRGSVLLPEDFASMPEESAAARELHHRYIDYQARGDADGMADDFFTEDARLVTAKMQIEGRENLRSFFGGKFEKDTDFHLVSMRNITGDDDYVWFEATAASSLGARTVYDVMLLRAGRVCAQFVGTLEGDLPANRSYRAESGELNTSSQIGPDVIVVGFV